MNNWVRKLGIVAVVVPVMVLFVSASGPVAYANCTLDQNAPDEGQVDQAAGCSGGQPVTNVINTLVKKVVEIVKVVVEPLEEATNPSVSPSPQNVAPHEADPSNVRQNKITDVLTADCMFLPEGAPGRPPMC